MKCDNSSGAIFAALILSAAGCSSDKSAQVEDVKGAASAGGSSHKASSTNASLGTSGGSIATSATRTSGENGLGGHSDSGGVTPASGGRGAFGSAASLGGLNATGIAQNTGGATGTVGVTVDGGRSGLNSSVASSGNANVGGSSASGGRSGTGGSVGTGGRSSRGGNTALGGATVAGGSSSTGGAPNTAGAGGSAGTIGPCDIFKLAGTPCVAAHSTVRALFGAYQGKLYQVRRADNTTKDIVTLTPGGFADGPTQDTFCSGTSCVMTVVYDQSGNGNDLWYQGSTVVPGSPRSSPAKADTESLTVGGHKVYSLYIKPGNSYWRDGSKSGVPTGKSPEGLYMVTSGKHVNNGCCFDYGNSETTRKADAAGAMDAINFGTQCWFGGCSGTGPWVQADLEWGLFPGGSQTWNANQKVFNSPYVTAMLKNNGTTEFALKGGNAQADKLTTLYKGPLPNGYSPMKKQGAIVLGSGGDCCKPDGGANLSEGTFYEGALVSGYPADATEDAIQSNIIAAGYGMTASEGF